MVLMNIPMCLEPKSSSSPKPWATCADLLATASCQRLIEETPASLLKTALVWSLLTRLPPLSNSIDSQTPSPAPAQSVPHCEPSDLVSFWASLKNSSQVAGGPDMPAAVSSSGL